MKTQKLLGAALFGTALLLSGQALAQSGGARDRLKAEKCYTSDGTPIDCEQQAKAAAAVVEKYPDATRPKRPSPRSRRNGMPW